MATRKEINAKNLRRICWLNGLSIVELSNRIARSRMSVYRAVRNPSTYPLTFKRILRALPKREVAHGKK